MENLFFVAIDHGDNSIARMLQKEINTNESNRLRRKIQSLVCQIESVQGVVVRPEDLDFAKKCEKKIAVGLPDVILSDDLEPLPIARHDCVKFGFHLECPNVGSQTVAEQVHRFISRSNDRKKWILEPYFNQEFTLEKRASVISALVAKCNEFISCFKLDMALRKSGENYSNACKPFPWLVRTTGLSFDQFCESLKHAMNAGCSGAIVGSAIWGDLIKRIDGEKANQIIEERCNRIERIIGKNNSNG